jgi:hypothetical protein
MISDLKLQNISLSAKNKLCFKIQYTYMYMKVSLGTKYISNYL